MAEHRDIEDVQRHENKGVTNAQTGTVATIGQNSSGQKYTDWRFLSQTNLGIPEGVSGAIATDGTTLYVDEESGTANGSAFVELDTPQTLSFTSTTAVNVFEKFGFYSTNYLNNMSFNAEEWGLESSIGGTYLISISGKMESLPSNATMLITLPGEQQSLAVNNTSTFSITFITSVSANSATVPQFIPSVAGNYSFSGFYYAMVKV